MGPVRISLHYADNANQHAQGHPRARVGARPGAQHDAPSPSPITALHPRAVAAWGFRDVGLELGSGRDGTARVQDASVRVPMVACDFLIFNFKYKM